MTHPQGYHVEHNGDCWQSVFPEVEAHLSQLHSTPEDAIEYMVKCGVQPSKIIVHDVWDDDSDPDYDDDGNLRAGVDHS